jgi:small GTP-binding protein
MQSFNQSLGNFRGLPNKMASPVSKISIIGVPAVGKTTLMKLIRGQLISRQYKPTQGFALGSTKCDDKNIKIWDFGGQKAYLKQHLAKYIHGSDLIFVVTDSTPKNVLTTKELIEYCQSLTEDAQFVAIANKQDLPGHMNPERVNDVLQIPTYGMVAIDRNNQKIMRGLINSLMNQVQRRNFK